MSALRVYLGELADILAYALKLGRPLDEVLGEMFGDNRRRVDADFPVGPYGETVHVVGVLDYVFHDWRSGRSRILDYKLTPSQTPANDLFQVCVYVLMHHLQHQTEADAGVLYLHPTRQMVEKKWEDTWAERGQGFQPACVDARMGPLTMSEPATVSSRQASRCSAESCKWNEECVRRLGPKNEGGRIAASTPASVVGEGPAGKDAPFVDRPHSPRRARASACRVRRCRRMCGSRGGRQWQNLAG